MNPKYQELYKYLKGSGMTDLDENSFYNKYSDPANSKEIWSYLKNSKMTDLDENSFYASYFGGKKKEVSQSTLDQDNTSSDRLDKTTTKPTVSSSLKGEGIYTIPGQAEGVFFKKEADGWYKKQYGVFDYKKVTDPNRIKKIEANTVEYKPQPKEELYILDSNPDALYKRSGNKWMKKIGNNYVPLTGDKISEREKILNEQARKATKFDLDRMSNYAPDVEQKAPVKPIENKELKKSFEEKYGDIKVLEKEMEQKRLEELNKPAPVEKEYFNWRIGAGKIFDFDDPASVEAFKNISPSFYMDYYDSHGNPIGIMDAEKMKIAEYNMKKDFGENEFKAYHSIADIPSREKLASLGEGNAAKLLNSQFQGTNIRFYQDGSEIRIVSKIGEGINEEILNEKTFDLNYSGADKYIKSFAASNLLKKSEKEKFDKVSSIDDLVEIVGTNPYKFPSSLLDGIDVDTYYSNKKKVLEGELARSKADTYQKDSEAFSKEVESFNTQVKGGKMSQQEFETKSAELEAKRKELENRRRIISNTVNEAEKIDNITNNLYKANVIDSQKKEQEGSFLGVIGRQFGQGLTNVSKTALDFTAAAASLFTDAETFANSVSPGSYQNLKNLGYTDEEIKNETQKQIKSAGNKIIEDVPDVFGGGTTKEYVQSKDRGQIEQAVSALAESIGTMAGGAGLAPGSKLAQDAAFFAMSYNAMEDQMRGPAFDGLSENEKKIISLPYGLIIGQLEKYGAKVGLSAADSPILNAFSKYVMSKVFTSLPKNASLLEIKSAIDKSVAASVANGMIKIVGAGFVEGGTEFTQQVFEGVEKDIANKIIQSNQLDAAGEKYDGQIPVEIVNQIKENKFFKDAGDLTTYEGISNLLSQSVDAFNLGFLAGGIGGAVDVAIKDPIENKISNNRFKIYKDVVTNDQAREGFISAINKKVDSGELTRVEADNQIKSVNDSYSTMMKIPNDLSTSAQKEAFSLMSERNQLEKQIAGKDPSLVAKQKDRVAEIDQQLKGLSYAVQERSTEEVLPREPETTGEAGGQREGMGQGVQGEIVTEEGQTTQEEKVTPKAEIGGIIRGYESISEQDNVGDVRSQLPNQNQGTAVVEGKDGNQYAVAFSRKGGDGKNIFEQGVTTPRPGYISASVKIEENATPEQVQAAQQEAQRNLEVILPTVVGGAINPQAINDIMAQQPVAQPSGKTGQLNISEPVGKSDELTTVEVDQVAAYRAEEQAELLKAIPEIENYKVDGEIDKNLMPKTVLEKYNQIYEKYDKLISPLLETATQPKAAIASENEITEKNVRTMSVKYKRNPIVRTATNILKALPGVKIYLHENTDQYSEALANKTGENKQSIQSEESAGSYIDGEIHLDMSQANTVTLLHEAVHHALMVNGVKGNYIIDMANGLRDIIKDEARLAELDAFIKQYKGETDQETLETRSDEFVAQLGGILAANQEELTTTGLTKFKALINRLFKKLGLGNVFTKASTSQDAVNFINTITRGLNVGENINNIGINGVFDTKNAKRKKSILATGLFERYPDNPNTKVEENVPLSRFNGKRSNVFESDRMTGAYIADDKGNKVFNFFGGIFFPRITGKWWASSSLSTATSIANNSKRDADGYIYGTPIIMSPGSQMSNNDMLLATLEFMKMDVMRKNSGVSKPELMTYIEKAFEKKKITGKKNILKNALKRTNNIEQIFDELEYVLFQEDPYIKDRSGNYILTDTRDRISKLTFEERKEIVSGILGDPKVMGSKFPSAGSMSQMSEKFTEPETLKSGKLWDIVVVYRTKGNLTAKAASKSDEFYHKSYPYEILAVDENGNPAEIEVFMLDGAYNLTEAIPEMTKSSGDVFTWAEHEAAIKSGKYKSEAVALNQYGRTSKLSRGSGEISARKKQLVAPNGKPSNLNEKQWNQVRTPEFKKWFGDWENYPKNASKVVDENGEPKVVYHGSMNQFDEFKKEELGKATGSESSMLGFYFSDNKEVSETYISPSMNQLDPNLDGLQSALDKMTKKQLGQFNVDVLNYYDNSDSYGDTDEDLEYFRDDLFTTVRIDSEGYLFDSQRYLEKAEKFIRSNNIDPDFRAYPEGYIYPTFINIRNPYIKDYKGDLWEYTPEFDNISKNNDGAILENTLDSVPTDERDGGIESNVFIVFEPNQIKSATENVGTFSTETPKIKFQKAPKILGQKPTKVIVNDEAKALIGQIKLEVRAQREQKKVQTEVRKSITDSVKALVKKGSINLKQASTVISTLNRVNLDNPEMVKRFNDYVAKVFDKAEYIDKVDRATRMKKKIKQNLKGASNPFAIAAKGFSQLEPKWVENIDDYIAVAQAVYDSVRKSTVRKGVINWKQEADFQEIAQYVFDEEARQTEVLLGNLRNLYERITGKSSDGVGADVMQAELKDMSIPEDFSADVMDQIEERLAEFEQMVEDTDPEVVQKAASIDPTIIPAKEAIRILDALDTYFTNGSIAGLNELMEIYTGKENAIKFKYKAKPLRALGSKKLAQTKFQSITQFNMILERKFRTKEAALAYKKASGIQDIENGANKAEKQAMDKQREYVSKFGKVKGFNSAENVFQRGALANLLRTMVASEEMQQAEFDRNIEILRNSVDTLSKGNSNDQKKAKVYKKVLTELGVFNPDVNLEMVSKNAKKENIDAVNFVIDMFGEIVDPLSDLALGMYNQILTQDINYTPYVYKMTDLKGNYGSKDYGGTDKNGNPNLSFFGTSTYANQTFDKNKAGVLMPITRPKDLRAGMHVDLDFDNNMFRQYRNALVDIYTAGPIRRLDGFFNSEQNQKILNSNEDQEIIYSALVDYIRTKKGSSFVTDDGLKFLNKISDYMAQFGAARALVGVGQFINQFSSGMSNTIVNAGEYIRPSDISKDTFEFIANSGRSIANVGGDEILVAMGEVDKSIERANLDSKYRVDQTLLKFIAKENMRLFNVLVAYPDAVARKLAWMAYYRKSMVEQGLLGFTESVDTTKPVNDKAADYAQMMVDRNMDSTDAALRGSLFRNRNSAVKILRSIFMPFSSFGLNQKNRMWNDLNALVSGKDMVTSTRSLASIAGELVVYNAIRYYIAKAILGATLSLLGYDDDDQEELYNKLLNNAKLSSFSKLFTDIVSPVPMLDNQTLKLANKTLKGSSLFQADQEAVDKYVEKLKAKGNLTDEEIEAKKKAFEEKNSRSFYVDTEANIGTLGIQYEKAIELLDLVNAWRTGEYTDDYNNERFLTKDSREKLTAPLMMKFFATVYGTRELDQVANKSFKLVKDAESMSKTQKETYSEVKKELGRDLTEFETSIINKKRTADTAIDEIKFIERNGGLNKEKGSEYLKLLEANPSPTKDMLRDIQNGKTAEQIIKKSKG